MASAVTVCDGGTPSLGVEVQGACAKAWRPGRRAMSSRTAASSRSQAEGVGMPGDDVPTGPAIMRSLGTETTGPQPLDPSRRRSRFRSGSLDDQRCFVTNIAPSKRCAHREARKRGLRE